MTRATVIKVLIVCVLFNAFMTSVSVWRVNKDYVRVTHMSRGCTYVEHYDNRVFRATRIDAHLVCQDNA